MENENIKINRDSYWEEVFCFWYENEGKRENWIKLAKDRGFDSWADWRLAGYAIPFECASAEWNLAEVANPAQTISSFHGGPFRTWIERHYDGAKTMTFAELAKRPDIRNHPAVISMMKSFPTDAMIICLQLESGIFVIEGMHRACALAVMASEGKELKTKLKIALGVSKLKELPIVGQNTK